jgi:hypothetical protein
MGATTSETPGGVCAATASVFAETIGQSIANIGPTLTPAIKISVVVGLARICCLAFLPYPDGRANLRGRRYWRTRATLSARRIVVCKMRN